MKRSGQIISRAPKFPVKAVPSRTATAPASATAPPAAKPARYGERELAASSQPGGPRPFTTIAITTALGLAVGGAYLGLAPREYTAASKLFVGHGESATTRPTGDALVNAQADVLRSSEVLRVAEATEKLGQTTATFRGVRDPVPALRRGLQIDVAPDGGVISVAFAARQSDDAVRIVNAVVAAYKKYVGDRRLDRTAQLTSAAEAIRKPLVEQLAEATRSLAAIPRGAPGDSLDAARQRVRTLADTATQAELATADARRRYDVAVAEAGPQLARLSDEQLDRAVQSSDGQAVQPAERVGAELDAATRRLADLKRTYADNHPSVIRARDDVDRLRLDRVVSTRQAWQAAAARVATLRASADHEQGDVTSIAQADAERGRLQAEVERLQTRIADANRQLDQAVLGGAYSTLDVEVLTPAEADDPTRPPTPRPAPTLLLAAMAGLISGGLLAIAGEYRRAGTLRHVTTIRPGKAGEATLAREAFGLRVLGSLPDVTAADGEDSAETTFKSATSGELATAAEKLPAELSAEGWTGGSLAVASATAAQGRSLVAFTLGAALARGGASTLLIEADARAGRPSDVGLGDVLAGGGLEGRPQASTVPGLMVLRVGEPREDFSALLNSPRLSELIEAARATFANVVFDCPPLDASDDGRLIAATADAAVIVSDGAVTSLRRAATARDVLKLAGGTVLGVVLNRTADAAKPREDANGDGALARATNGRRA